MDKFLPKITVIVAVYNAKNTLKQCIDSILNQSYSNTELIIIDGGSTDGSVDILKQNNQKIDYWISEPDKGIYNAWNKAIPRLTGDWVCFLGADDYFFNQEVLSIMVHYLDNLSENIGVVYSRIMLIGIDGETLFSIGDTWEKARRSYPYTMPIPHPGALHRASLFKEYGLFNEAFKIAGDYEFLLRVFKNKEALYIPDLLSVGMRQGGISSNPYNSLDQLKEVRSAQQSNGVSGVSIYWILAVVRVYIRLIIWRLLGEATSRKLLDIGRKIMGKPAFWTKV
jgi:glycosyltransferase involved in cell wall biosynthesis